MKIVSLDVHAGSSQLLAVSAAGEVLLEMKVATECEELRRIVGAIPGPKRVVFEEGPLSGMIRDALEGVADEVISCDPARNAMIALAEDSNDERDARRLAKLARLGAIHPVYVPPERYRTLRSVLMHDRCLERWITSAKNRIKALCRRHAIPCRGKGVYRQACRGDVLKRLGGGGIRWQMESVYRQLDMVRRERIAAHRVVRKEARGLPEVRRLQTVPGVGPITARTMVAWIVDPGRFKSRNALSSYGGLGLGQGWTNWKPVGRARASRRGQRELKRVLFIAAQAAIRGNNALARRYEARLESGWEARKAIRDVARTILFVACGVWITGKEYDDARIMVPAPQVGRRAQRRRR